MKRSSPSPRAIQSQADALTSILRYVEEQVARGFPADAALDHLYRTHREYGARDRRFFSEAVFSFFRWKGWTMGSKDLSPELAAALSFYLDSGERHPAADRLLEAAGKRPSDVDPAGSKNLETKAHVFRKWTGQSESALMSNLVPRWFPETVHTSAGTDPELHARKCIEAFQIRPPTWLRAQPGQEQKILDGLQSLNVPSRLHPSVRSAVECQKPANRHLLEQAVGSCFEIQDLASQCVALACRPEPGQRWWDACAGAGGKTLHLASLMQDRGNILSSEIRKDALAESKRRIRKSGFRSISTVLLDTQKAGPRGEPFDGVLVDAPCSGLGTWSRNPDARWRTSAGMIEEKAALQFRLLTACAHHVRSGGALVYAVCTLTRAESVEVVHRFLNEQTDFSLDPTAHPLSGQATNGEFWIWPWDGPCDGMYIARLVKSL